MSASRYVRYELWSGASLEGMVALGGSRVVIELGGERVVQELEDDDAAREHVERFVRLRKKDQVGRVDRVVEVPIDAAGFEDLARPVPENLLLDRQKKMALFRMQPDAAAVLEMVRFAPLVVRVGCSMGCEPVAPLFREIAVPSVRTFIFDGGLSQDQLGRNNASGDLATIFTSMPNLRRAYCSGKLALSETKHRALQELYLLGNPIDPVVIDALGRSHFPAFRQLGISLGCDEIADHVALPDALRRLDAPNLRRVELEIFEDVAEFLDRLCDAGVPPSWTELTVRNTAIGVLDVEATSVSGHARVTVTKVSTGEFRGRAPSPSAERWLEVLRKHRGPLSRLSRLRLPVAALPRAARKTAAQLVPSLAPDGLRALGDASGFLVDWEYGKRGRRTKSTP